MNVLSDGYKCGTSRTVGTLTLNRAHQGFLARSSTDNEVWLCKERLVQRYVHHNYVRTICRLPLCKVEHLKFLVSTELFAACARGIIVRIETKTRAKSLSRLLLPTCVSVTHETTFNPILIHRFQPDVAPTLVK